MNDYISRQAVLNLIYELQNFYENEGKESEDFNLKMMYVGSINALTAMEDGLSDIPAADVRPVVREIPTLRCRPERYERYTEHGLSENGEMLYIKQVYVDEKSYAMYCPACGKRLCSRFTNFCSNCGADMRGKHDATP